MKPIVVMGATSGIGKCVVDEAAHRGLPVRAFARGAAAMEPSDAIKPWPGDALNPADVAGVLDGAGSVIYALGIKERPSMLWQEETLFSESTRVLLPAMEAAGVRRLVAVTGFGAGRSVDAMSRPERLGHRAILGRPYADKDRQEKLIEASALDWTIVRPVILTKGARTGRYRAEGDPARWRNGLISRADVAVYLVDAVVDDRDIRTDIVLAR